jgi:hypothetical protein
VASSSITKTLRKAGYQAKHFHYIKGDFNSSESSVSSTIGTASLQDKQRRIITLTRDPVARNISAFFQNLDVFCHAGDARNAGKLIEIFFNKYNQDIPLNWFDREFREATGIDVYKHEFNKELGYSVIGNRGLEVLIIKSEISDDNKTAGLRSFLGDACGIRAISKSNVGVDKNYADVYNDFLGSVVFRDGYLDRMYHSKYVRHFYTENEIREFYARWKSN